MGFLGFWDPAFKVFKLESGVITVLGLEDSKVYWCFRE